MINIGNFSFIAPSKIQAILDIKDGPAANAIEQARKGNRVYDCTKGNDASTAIIMDNGSIYLSSMGIKAIRDRIKRMSVSDDSE